MSRTSRFLPSILFIFSILQLPVSTVWAQKPFKPNAADLHQAIKKLNVLGTVLYVAAHPDDENTRLISYLRNEKLYDVTYLSMTRGDGGQNLIGPEIRELLGVLRTEELLMARSVDGGKQRFTRANDFGFSKSPDETLRFWDKDAVLADVVWTYRQVKPDVVINRFYHDKKYDTHGHHTASAMLSVEAFDLAAKQDAYPEQLSLVQPWQARRQFFNTSWFFYGSQDAFAKVDKSNLWPIDIGVYLPLKGKSNNEVAAESRSMHRCQGFGSLSTRGESLDYLDFVKGDKPASQDIFDGINTTWSRFKGGEPIGKLMTRIDKEYRSDDPAASVPNLLKAMKMIESLPEASIWKPKKLAEIKEVIRGCLGLYLEATAADPTATPGDQVKIRLEAINRSTLPVQLSGVTVNPGLFDTMPAFALASNQDWTYEKRVRIGDDAGFTAPYWLLKAATLGMYGVDNQALRGMPETPRYATVHWKIMVNEVPLEYETEVAWKTGEPAVGEVWRPFEVLPPAVVEFTEPSYIFTQNDPEISLRVKALKDGVKGNVVLSGWSGKTLTQAFECGKKGEEKLLRFKLETGEQAETTLSAAVEVDGKSFGYRLVTIKYDHIPQQSVLLPATVHAAKLDLKVKAKNVGYYAGAGDDVPEALRQMGCTVTMLEDKDMDPANLAKFDAIVVGIRAYNTRSNLRFDQTKLLEYAKNGGTLIVQYNTNAELVTDQLGPYPFKLSRTRVTDEGAEMRPLLPDHPVMKSPNMLTNKDFDGWVQERGLYYPGEWDASYQALLSSNDPGEKAADGALLVASYGKGYYVYTALSFFRELPAGVPGAYRLFANLISLGR